MPSLNTFFGIFHLFRSFFGNFRCFRYLLKFVQRQCPWEKWKTQSKHVSLKKEIPSFLFETIQNIHNQLDIKVIAAQGEISNKVEMHTKHYWHASYVIKCWKTITLPIGTSQQRTEERERCNTSDIAKSWENANNSGMEIEKFRTTKTSFLIAYSENVLFILHLFGIENTFRRRIAEAHRPFA